MSSDEYVCAHNNVNTNCRICDPDDLRERAEDMALNTPASWPDDASWEKRVSYLEQALRQTREEALEEAGLAVSQALRSLKKQPLEEK